MVTKVENKRSVMDLWEITVAEGQHLRIRTGPDGDDILDSVCPAGEVWSVRIHIEIEISEA